MNGKITSQATDVLNEGIAAMEEIRKEGSGSVAVIDAVIAGADAALLKLQVEVAEEGWDRLIVAIEALTAQIHDQTYKIFPDLDPLPGDKRPTIVPVKVVSLDDYRDPDPPDDGPCHSDDEPTNGRDAAREDDRRQFLAELREQDDLDLAAEQGEDDSRLDR